MAKIDTDKKNWQCLAAQSFENIITMALFSHNTVNACLLPLMR